MDPTARELAVAAPNKCRTTPVRLFLNQRALLRAFFFAVGRLLFDRFFPAFFLLVLFVEDEERTGLS